MADYQHHPDIAPLARRISTLVATLRRLETFMGRDLPASIGHELHAAELAVAQLIDDTHERMVSRWTVKELPRATPVPSGVRVTRYDANGQPIGRR